MASRSENSFGMEYELIKNTQCLWNSFGQRINKFFVVERINKSWRIKDGVQYWS